MQQRKLSNRLTGGTYLSNGNSRLNFRNISKYEAGDYACVATNPVGRKTTGVSVTVLRKYWLMVVVVVCIPLPWDGNAV